MARGPAAHPLIRSYCLARRQLQLILMPTERCNFRCPYCFEDRRRARMSRDVVDRVKRLLDRRVPGLRVLVLDWFGGEPLLALDVVEEVQAHAARLRERHPGLVGRASMTTNGYLLDTGTFDTLLDLGVRSFQIAFDGPRESHDGRRVLAGGGATFDRIWNNLIAMRDDSRPFEVWVRLQFDPAHRTEPDGFLEPFAETFGTDSRFRLFLTPLHLPRTACSIREPMAGEGASALEEAGRAAERLGLSFHRGGRSFPVCPAAMRDSFVVRADGSLGRCAMAPDDPRNRVGKLLADGELEVDGAKIAHWMRGATSGDPLELRCPARGYVGSLFAAGSSARNSERKETRFGSPST